MGNKKSQELSSANVVTSTVNAFNLFGNHRHETEMKQLEIVATSDKQNQDNIGKAITGITEELKNPDLSNERREYLSNELRYFVELSCKKNTETSQREEKRANEKRQTFCKVAEIIANVAVNGSFIVARAYFGGRCYFGSFKPTKIFNFT